MTPTKRYFVALLVLAACGGTDATAPRGTGSYTGGTGGTGGTGSTGGTGGTPGTTAAVNVEDNFFSPTPVTILKGGTVTWTFVGTGHNVTFDDNTGSGANATSFSKTFAAAGTYNYQCTNHYGMTAQVVVQ